MTKKPKHQFLSSKSSESFAGWTQRVNQPHEESGKLTLTDWNKSWQANLFFCWYVLYFIYDFYVAQINSIEMKHLFFKEHLAKMSNSNIPKSITICIGEAQRNNYRIRYIKKISRQVEKNDKGSRSLLWSSGQFPPCSSIPSAVSVPKTALLLTHSSRAWCPKTARRLIGHRGVPARRPAAPLTCLLATASGHASWHKSRLEEAGDVRPLKKKRLATSLETYLQTAPGNQQRGGWIHNRHGVSTQC